MVIVKDEVGLFIIIILELEEIVLVIFISCIFDIFKELIFCLGLSFILSFWKRFLVFLKYFFLLRNIFFIGYFFS